MWTSNGGDDDHHHHDHNTTGDSGGENGGDDGDGNGDGGGRNGDGGERCHNDVLICLLGQQNSVMSGQGRPGTMPVSDTAVESGWHTARAARVVEEGELFKWLYAHAQCASESCRSNPRT